MMSPSIGTPSKNALRRGLRKAMRRYASGVDGLCPRSLRGDEDRVEAVVSMIWRRVRACRWEWKIAEKSFEPRLDGSWRTRGRATIPDAGLLNAYLESFEDEVWGRIPHCVIGGRPGYDFVGEVMRVGDLLHRAKREGADWYVLRFDVRRAYESARAADAFEILRRMVTGNVGALAAVESYYAAQKARFKGCIIEGLAVSPMMMAALMGEIIVPLAGEALFIRIYLDDGLMIFETRAAAERALRAIRDALDNFGMKLHPTKTRIQPALSGYWHFVGVEYPDAIAHPAVTKIWDLQDKVIEKVRADDLGAALATMEGWMNHYARVFFSINFDRTRFDVADQHIATELPGVELPGLAALAASVVMQNGKVEIPGAFQPLLNGWKAKNVPTSWEEDESP